VSCSEAIEAARYVPFQGVNLARRPTIAIVGDGATIIVETRWHPLTALFAFIFRTIVTIDGSTSVLPWGWHELSVSPGTHEVQVSLGRGVGVVGFPERMGMASIDVEAAAGGRVHLRYRAPIAFAWQAGRLEAVSEQ
jgi:hypothetical protein